MGTLKIEGAIDLHCHYGPDMVGIFPTTHSVTAIEAAREAAGSGYAALVLKAHDFATPALAHALMQVVPEVRVFGGITLDHLGATIELTAQSCSPVLGNAPDKTLPEMLAMIETIGAERCTLASDYGWSDSLPHPAAGLRDFFDALWAEGVPELQLVRMARDNPARLLGIAG